ncbi:MAG: hypothetical protein HC814_07405 [Rhodobacteraceae bacterium]|nr:hypothetical protein [Paracoccaceae bacterium]
MRTGTDAAIVAAIGTEAEEVGDQGNDFAFFEIGIFQAGQFLAINCHRHRRRILPGRLSAMRTGNAALTDMTDTENLRRRLEAAEARIRGLPKRQLTA